MKVWVMESYPVGDRRFILVQNRLPHHIFPPKFISSIDLPTFAGIYLYKVDLDDTLATKKRLARVKSDWSVVEFGMITLDVKTTTDINSKLDEMYEPSEALDDVVSLVLEGEIYYDVEYDDEKWIRLFLEKGDLVIFPKGTNYRSTVTSQNYVKLQRFKKEFQGDDAKIIDENHV